MFPRLPRVVIVLGPYPLRRDLTALVRVMIGGGKGTITRSCVEVSAIRTTFARIGWTVCSQKNTFLPCHVYK
jgi:hypothetical protein